MKVLVKGTEAKAANVSTTFDDAGKMTIVLTWADKSGKTIYDSPADVVITITLLLQKVLLTLLQPTQQLLAIIQLMTLMKILHQSILTNQPIRLRLKLTSLL